MRRLAVVLGGLLALLPASGGAALERVPAIVHIHSDLSTGDFPLEHLAREAERLGIGALFVSENYLLRIEYGLPPFRALTRATYSVPGVLDSGLERYLGRVAAVRRQVPGVLILPGVEVIPHYFWTGSPLALDLKLHNTQKNLLVFGVTDAETLRTLPSAGNPYVARYTWESLLDALPGLLVVPGIAMLLSRRRRLARIGRAVVVVRHRRWLAGALVTLVGATAIARGWPFTTDLFSPYADLGLEPHQALIDHVERLGGATIWSFPEAWDEGTRQWGPVRVAWRTDPYPDDLLKTFRYTAFGAVYEDTTRVELPREGWDRLLMQYAAGERSRPAWAVAESGFHGFSAGKTIGTIQTVFLVADRSEAALLDALKRGRAWALQRKAEVGLELAEFTVGAPGTLARSGETLRVPAPASVEVRIGIDASDRSALPLRVTLVRSGAVVGAWSATTPFRILHRETFDGPPAVFRVDVRGPTPHRLLTNPIFVAAP
ncbi:MAG: hypothetical protein HY727_06705 [Candidatus Rokubacteria bacterium]|nr:hypothetical protein [Candidatus Rokubacteria bacterium]